MSSYVISKENYIRVAGFIAGLTEIRDGLHIYHWGLHKKYDSKMLYNSFVHLYDLNRLSVQEQYDDEEPENDTNQYCNEFEKYKMHSKLNSNNVNDLMKITTFLSSVKYQIENEQMFKQADAFINKIVYHLSEWYSHRKADEYWGEYK